MSSDAFDHFKTMLEEWAAGATTEEILAATATLLHEFAKRPPLEVAQ